MTDIFEIRVSNGRATAEYFRSFPIQIEELQKRLEEYEVSEHDWYQLELMTNKAFEAIIKLDDVYIEGADHIYYGLRPQNLDIYLNKQAGNC